MPVLDASMIYRNVYRATDRAVQSNVGGIVILKL
jgi:hypothetical protein